MDNLVRFITTYNIQHSDIKHIMSKYWFLLTSDSVSNHYVSPDPSITFRLFARYKIAWYVVILKKEGVRCWVLFHVGLAHNALI